MRDTFLTCSYKSMYIHRCYDNVLRAFVVQVQDDKDTLHAVKSWRAAQLLITRLQKK